MSEEKGIDLLGIKPIGDAVNTTVTKSFDGAEGFLKRVCAPALEEYGLLLRDKVRVWRLNNVSKILEKAQGKLEFVDDKLQPKAHPRVALSIIENGSLCDDDELQNLWAGLFASSCKQETQDDENLIFVDLLKQLTSSEAKILKVGCERATKQKHPNGLVTTQILKISCDELIALTGITDVHRLDRQLDHLRTLGLIGSDRSGGFIAEDIDLVADITPTTLALNLFVKGQGSNGDPSKYWNIN